MQNNNYWEFESNDVTWALDIIKKYDEKFPRNGKIYEELCNQLGWIFVMLDYTANPEHFYDEQIKKSKSTVLSKLLDHTWAYEIDTNLLKVNNHKKNDIEKILLNFPNLPPYE